MDLTPIIPPLACSLDILVNVPRHIARWADPVVSTSNKYGIDVYLLFAIMDRESGGGIFLRPNDETGSGDFTPRGGKLPPDGFGYGRGLMQIDYESNIAWCALVDPDTGKFFWQLASQNVDKGGAIFSAKLAALNGDILASICAYNAGEGSLPGEDPEHPHGHGAKLVLANLPWNPSQDAKIAALDTITTGKNYVSDVLRRRASFLPQGAAT